MVELKCRDYGFECDFVASGQPDAVIDGFKGHTEEAHGIDYTREAVMQFIQRKHGP